MFRPSMRSSSGLYVSLLYKYNEPDYSMGSHCVYKLCCIKILKLWLFDKNLGGLTIFIAQLNYHCVVKTWVISLCLLYTTGFISFAS
jgi:hypothetical protein